MYVLIYIAHQHLYRSVKTDLGLAEVNARIAPYLAVLAYRMVERPLGGQPLVHELVPDPSAPLRNTVMVHVGTIEAADRIALDVNLSLFQVAFYDAASDHKRNPLLEEVRVFSSSLTCLRETLEDTAGHNEIVTNTCKVAYSEGLQHWVLVADDTGKNVAVWTSRERIGEYKRAIGV
jgi:hypothetical protein